MFFIYINCVNYILFISPGIIVLTTDKYPPFLGHTISRNSVIWDKRVVILHYIKVMCDNLSREIALLLKIIIIIRLLCYEVLLCFFSFFSCSTIFAKINSCLLIQGIILTFLFLIYITVLEDFRINYYIWYLGFYNIFPVMKILTHSERKLFAAKQFPKAYVRTYVKV